MSAVRARQVQGHTEQRIVSEMLCRQFRLAGTGNRVCVSCYLYSVEMPAEQGIKCECRAGYTQENRSLIHPVCTECAANRYQPEQAKTACFRCDENARSEAASVSPFDCVQCWLLRVKSVGVDRRNPHPGGGIPTIRVWGMCCWHVQRSGTDVGR